MGEAIASKKTERPLTLRFWRTCTKEEGYCQCHCFWNDGEAPLLLVQDSGSPCPPLSRVSNNPFRCALGSINPPELGSPGFSQEAFPGIWGAFWPEVTDSDVLRWGRDQKNMGKKTLPVPLDPELPL